MGRDVAAKVIHLTTLVAVLTVGWQAVKFAMGDSGNPAAPFLDFIGQVLGDGPIRPSSHTPEDTSYGSQLQLLVTGGHAVMVFCLGMTVWVVAAVIALLAGRNAARVAEVGWEQYRVELREADKAARIAAERQAYKDRRRKLQRKVREATEPRRKSSGLLPFMLGVLVGSFFL